MKKVNEIKTIKLLEIVNGDLITILYFSNLQLLRNLKKSFFLILRKMKNKGVWGYAPTSE